MNKLDNIIQQVVPGSAGTVSTVRAGGDPMAGRKATEEKSRRDHVDAINQIFAEFELAYHNQFHKAFAQEGSLNLSKKYWLNCLGDFLPEVILRAARNVVRSQEYLPTIAAMVAACENALPLFGLPPAHAAYVEACCAAEPKLQQSWSHPAVYLAGRETGWFALATETRSTIFPVFEYNYHQLCQRVLKGENLELSVPVALPESIPAPLSPEENRKKLQELRKKLDI